MNFHLKRDMGLDVVRCIANYMIVVLHAWAAFQYVSESKCFLEYTFWKFVCSHLAWLAVPTFFLVSGFLLFKGFSLETWPNKMWRRVKRLACPYVAWNSLFVLLYLAGSFFVPRLGDRVCSFALNTLDGAFERILSFTVHPIDGPLWFMRLIFLFAAISPALWVVMRIWKGLLVLLIGIAYCIAEVILNIHAELSHIAPAYAVCLLCLGGLLAFYGKDLMQFFSNRCWLIVGLTAFLIRTLMLMQGVETDAPASSRNVVLVTVLSIFEAPVLICAVARLNVAGMVDNVVYKTLSSMSFFVYAGHFLFCSIWLHGAAPFLGKMQGGKMSALVMIFTFCGIATMCVAYLSMKKCLPRLARVFDGTM